jgi:two-component system, OmpR family, sensor kinase
MIFNSIRWRLQAWHGLILLVVLAGFGLTAYHVARDNQLRRIDQELEQRLWMLFRMPPPGPPPPDRAGPGTGAPNLEYPSEQGAPTLSSRENDARPPDGPWAPGHPKPLAGPSSKVSPSSPPPEDGRHERPGGHNDPARFRERLREAIQRFALTEAGQTNSFYFVMWECEGTLLARSTNTPATVTMPARPWAAAPPSAEELKEDKEPSKGQSAPEKFYRLRTRGVLREAFVFAPFGDCLLVGRSMGPDLAAMRRLALWLGAAGAGVLIVGLAGGWWLASRAIRPVEDISSTALKIAGGDLSQRIDAADTESELGRLAAVLNSTFARLEAAFAHQSRFTSDASHELRTPVSVILSQVQTVLSKERTGADYREALEACQRAALRMKRLTESLLELARLDAGQQPMKHEPFDLARVARECVELVRPLAAERGLELQCELLPTSCQGDSERIGQVATNLLTNAIHFNRENGQVRISTLEENGSVILSVSDTGPGIPPEDLPHIFERFYRVDKSRSRIQGRTGLGLAITKAIVDAHSGTVEVSSQPGIGSTFKVRLPAK